MKHGLKLIIAAAAGALLAGQASAQNIAPPAGAVLDLAGTVVPSGWAQYSTSFTATTDAATLTIAMRNDPSFIYLDDVSMVDVTNPSGNLVTNGGFEGTTYSGTPTSGTSVVNLPTGWGYQNINGATWSGTVANTAGTAHSGNAYWYDGAVQSYDALNQTIATTIGDTYTVSFWANIDPAGSTLQAVSTNNLSGTSGNGIDALVYNSPVTINDVPEPASMALLGLAFAGLSAVRRRRTA